jgi:hypothetical protein
MVARSHNSDEGVDDFFDPRLDPDRFPGVHIVTSPEEAQAIFDRRVRHELGISGDEFLRRWNAGEYGVLGELPDTTEGRRIRRLVDLISFAYEPFP